MATMGLGFDPVRLSLWGYLKIKLYQKRPNDLEELKGRIRTETAQITPEVLGNVRKELNFTLDHT